MIRDSVIGSTFNGDVVAFVKLKFGLKYEELVDVVYKKLNIDPNIFRLRVSLRFMSPMKNKYGVVLLVDDDDLEYMFESLDGSEHDMLKIGEVKNLIELTKCMTFESKDKLTNMVKKVYITNNLQIKVVKSDSVTCEVAISQDHLNLSSSYITEMIMDLVVVDSTVSEKVLMVSIVKEVGINHQVQRHLPANFAKQFKKEGLKKRVVEMYSQLTHEKLNVKWQALLATEPRTDEWFSEMQPKHSSLACDEGKRFGIMTKNMAKIWNNLLLVVLLPGGLPDVLDAELAAGVVAALELVIVLALCVVLAVELPGVVAAVMAMALAVILPKSLNGDLMTVLDVAVHI
ncbi:hypothetical protein AgCh_021186 [Apium graveolens]